MRRRKLSEQRVLVFLFVGDLVGVLAGLAVAFALRIWFPLPLTSALLPADRLAGLRNALLVATVTQFPLLYLFGLYDSRHLRSRAHLVLTPASALAVQLVLMAAWYFFVGLEGFPRSVLLIFTVVNLATVSAVRLVARRELLQVGEPVRILLVGEPTDTAEFRETLRDADPEARRFQVAGELPPSAHEAIVEATSREDVDSVILVDAVSWKDVLLDRVLRDGVGSVRPRVAVVPSVYDLLVGRLASLSIEDVPMIEIVKSPREELAFRVKSVVDYVLATILLGVALPVCAIAAVAIALTSPGPVLYRQRRVGRHGREFVMYKLRTMLEDAESESGPILARDGDDRITRVGRFLRATRIDEIPQLLNVLNGTMSLIGPRPERPEFAAQYEREIPGYGERWLVKPGLSGLAQVRGEYHTPPAYKIKYDLAYIYNYSLLLDLRIMAETGKALFTRRGV